MSNEEYRLVMAKDKRESIEASNMDAGGGEGQLSTMDNVRLIVGFVFMLVAAFIFCSIASYLFYWKSGVSQKLGRIFASLIL